MSSIKRIVLVGHCGFDSSQLESFVRRTAGGVDVISAGGQKDVEAHASPESLLLINRQLGWGFDAKSGVDLISRLSEVEAPPKLMLISNYADAQQQAEEAGALPGFGKAQIGSAEATATLRDALATADVS